MTTFLIGLVILVGGGFFYGKFVEKVLALMIVKHLLFQWETVSITSP